MIVRTVLSQEEAIAIASKIMLRYPVKVYLNHTTYGPCILLYTDSSFRLKAIAKTMASKQHLELVHEYESDSNYIGIFN